MPIVSVRVEDLNDFAGIFRYENSHPDFSLDRAAVMKSVLILDRHIRQRIAELNA